MRPLFFVQNNLVDRFTVPVARFAHRHGVALEDRSSTREFDPADCGIDWAAFCPVLPYGSVQLLRKLMTVPALRRFLWHDETAFSASTWRERLGALLLNGDGSVATVDEVAGLLRERPLHVRPESQDKAFNARVFTAQGWGETLAERQLDGELSCWVSPVHDIHREWRCWLVGGELVAMSQYRAHNEMAVQACHDPSVAHLVEQVCGQWVPAPCVVLDVAETAHGLRVLEFNPIHCSGWYAVDADQVLARWLQWSVAHFSPEAAG